MKRLVVALTMVATLVVSSGSALADKPARSCPDRFRLATLQDILDIFGPEGNVPAIENFFESNNEIPTPVNPLLEPESPRNCDLEDGRIIFLGAATDCKIPEEKAVAFAGAFWECSTGEGLGDTYAELRGCAVKNFERDFNPDVHHVRIWIDGQILRHPHRWTVLTPIPSDLINFPEDNIWGAEPGPSKSVTKGRLLYPSALVRGHPHNQGQGA